MHHDRISNSNEFTLELCASCIRALDRSVLRMASDHGREAKAMEAGRRIRNGSRDIFDLVAIANWKAPRAAHHLKSNTAEGITAALNVATDADVSVEQKVEALDELVGVNVPMASAILTCIYPDAYTVIDTKALDALRLEKPIMSKELFARYLSFCRSAASSLGVELRQLDRALWKSGSIG